MCLVVLGLGVRALGAEPQKVGISAAVGWNGVLYADRWCPIRVMISGRDGRPLDRAFGGTLLVRTMQDATQAAELRLAVATTPGRLGRVDGAVHVPRSAGRIEIVLESADGEVVAGQVFTQSPNVDRGEQPMPVIGALGCLAALTDGTINLPDKLLKQWRRREDAFDPAMRVQCQRVRPEDFPVEPVVYQGVHLLVVDAATSFEPRVIAAIREWVLGGGRLVVIANRGGDAWRSWLAMGPQSDVVRVGEPIAGPLPESVGQAVVTPMLNIRVQPGERSIQINGVVVAPPADPDSDSVVEPAPSEAAATPPEAAEQDPAEKQEPAGSPPEVAAGAMQRVVTLTERGRAEGWKIRWGSDGDPERGLIAEGPVGLGMVAVLGVDPRKVVKGEREADAMGAWRSALDGVLADQAGRDGVGTDDEYRYQSASGDSVASARALQAVLDSTVSVNPLDFRVFIIIGVAMVLLSLLVGPGDYFFFRSPLRRHRSWMSALLWIALASALSYIGPSFMRDSRTQVRRVSVIDAVQSDQPGVKTLAFQTSVTSIWAGATRSYTPIGADGQPLGMGAASSAWFRGVSGVPLSWHDDASQTLPRVPLVQRPPGIDASSDPWGGVAAELAGSTLPAPGELFLRTWTLRALADDVRLPSFPLFATRIGEGTDSTLRLGGVPAGAELERAVVRIGDDWYQPTFKRSGPAGAEEFTAKLGGPLSRTDADGRSLFLTPPEGRAWDRASDSVPLGAAGNSVGWGMPAAFGLPGVNRRTLATSERAAGGKWMVLYLELKNMPMDVSLREASDATRRVVVRLSVPTERLP